MTSSCERFRASWVRKCSHGVAVLAATLGAVGALAAPAGASRAPATVWTDRRVLDVAHAGGDLEAPHSTLFAMKTAVAGGADVLEMDLRLSSDGVIMIQHDDTVDRTTGATGPVSGYTAAQLQALDNAYWFVPNCWSCHDRPAGEYTLRGIRTGDVAPPAGFTADDFGIPTLAQVRAAFPDRILDVELKEGVDSGDAEALAEFIATHGPADRYLVASFDDAVMAHFKSLAPGVATSPGLGQMTDWFLNRGALPGHAVLQVPPTYGDITVVSKQFVDDAHANGLAVWVWFNGEGDDIESVWNQLLDDGVDALLTGHPVAAQALLAARRLEFAAPPTLGPVAGAFRGGADIGVQCPLVHVATCAGTIVLVAYEAHGGWRIAATGTYAVVGGRSGRAHLRLTRFGRFVSERRPLPAIALVFPANTDTAAAVQAVTLTRPQPLV